MFERADSHVHFRQGFQAGFTGRFSLRIDEVAYLELARSYNVTAAIVSVVVRKIGAVAIID